MPLPGGSVNLAILAILSMVCFCQEKIFTGAVYSLFDVEGNTAIDIDLKAFEVIVLTHK